MFISALFTRASRWKQPKYSLTEKWIKKMWYMYIYTQWNITQSFAVTCMDLEIVILSEVSQRNISYAFAYMQNLKKV